MSAAGARSPIAELDLRGSHSRNPQPLTSCAPSGVADGVGGWALSGVDSGEYSRLLMQMAQLFAESKKLDAHPKKVRGRCASAELLCLGSRQCHIVGHSSA